jgi:nucleotide-binding universal stress UspA family protein
MHDPRTLLDPATDAVKRLARRGYRLDLVMLRELTGQRGSAINGLDEARAEANRLAQKRGTNTERGRALRATITEGQQRVRNAEEALRAFLLDIPNLPENLCPDGDSDKFAVPVRTWSTPAGPGPDHVEIGERLGIFDFTRATKLSGPRFSVLRGVGAQLERALGYLFLDLHARRGYIEYSLPALVTRASMTGTGQLPKFDEDLFHTSVTAVRGSVGAKVAAQARCPVIIARTPPASRNAPVVLGVDGSAASNAATDFAFDYASSARTGVRAVHAWHRSVLPGAGDIGTQRRAHLRVVTEALAAAADCHPDVPTWVVSSPGGANDVLSYESMTAQLIVVGSHGHGLRSGLLLGSVSQALLHTASCPLAIIPATER